MKKILLSILLIILLSFGFSVGEDLSNFIKSNYEYLDYTGKKLYSATAYESNKGNSIFVYGAYSYFPIKDKQEIEFVKMSYGYNDSDIIFFINGNSYNLLSKSKNSINPSICNDLDSYSYILFENYEKKVKVNVNSDILLGNSLTYNCYKYGNNLYLPTSELENYDLAFFMVNSKYVYNEIKGFADKTVKDMYTYLISNTSYNFGVLEYFNPNVNPSDYTPWRVSSFFENKQMVCDGYTKTLNMFLNVNGITSSRVVGSLQPIEESSLNIPGVLHSWVKIGDKHYDPTFDDSDNKLSYNYFGKSKTCFNINHYTTGWQYFDTIEKRYKYILNNGQYLLGECPYITKNAILSDYKLDEFIGKSLNRYSLEANSNLICELVGVCEDYSSKQEILETYKLYNLKYRINGKDHNYNFKEILKDFEINEKTGIIINIDNTDNKEEDNTKNKEKPNVDLYKSSVGDDFNRVEEKINEKIIDLKYSIISNDEKVLIEKIFSKVNKILSKKSFIEKRKLINEIEKLFKDKINSSNVSKKRKEILVYFYNLFVEKYF